MPTITTNDGVQLYYEDVGAGRPLLLIPGWACTHHFFQKNIATRGPWNSPHRHVRPVAFFPRLRAHVYPSMHRLVLRQEWRPLCPPLLAGLLRCQVRPG
jgi:pimeloyl-ACP methyl ester carboxylesterase